MNFGDQPSSVDIVPQATKFQNVSDFFILQSLIHKGPVDLFTGQVADKRTRQLNIHTRSILYLSKFERGLKSDRI